LTVYTIFSKESALSREEIFDRFQDQGFIKTGDRSASGLSSAQKVVLNRKGNELINRGDVEGARRIFQTTGYTDGLVRVGDRYLASGRSVDALKMYWIAPDKKKADAIIAKLSAVIQKLAQEEEG
jgi:hypothetical protein